MPEGIDQNLKNEWNKKLEEHGLPEKIKSRKIPIMPSSGREIFETLDPDMEKSMEKFSKMSREIQDRIIEDVKKLREVKSSIETLKKRFYFLVDKSEEFNEMPGENSDKDHTPAPSRERLERDLIREGISNQIDDFIDRIEKIRAEDKPTTPDAIIN